MTIGLSMDKMKIYLMNFLDFMGSEIIFMVDCKKLEVYFVDPEKHIYTKNIMKKKFKSNTYDLTVL